jgi:hypothetical protein
MLARNSYERSYVDACRAEIERQVNVYRGLAAVGTSLRGAARKDFEAALAAFEPIFFNDLVLVLESYFVHRTRAVEGKDGNALNEVRLFADSLMTNDGRLRADKQIELRPESSVVGYAVGDQIRLSEDDFTRLAKAFFADLESKFI